jgi:D-cysteine desulfhydrase
VRGLVSPRVEVFVKREDQAADLYGGNKVRKLELLLGDPRLGPGGELPAEPGGRRPRLLTYGTYGSNYTLATGVFGRALGYDVSAVLYPQPVTPLVRGRLREQLGAGVRLWLCPSYLHVPLQRARARREGPVVELAPGGSSPLGTLGWVSGGLEIAAQVAEGVAPRFDAVYAALGSGGMIAGLWLGLGDATTELIAVRVAPWPAASRTTVRWLAGRTAALLRALQQGARPPRALPPRPLLRLDHRWVGGGYGHPTPAALAAIARASAVGLRLEPTYTGKALAALLADADSGLLDGKRVLFIHSYNGVELTALRERGDETLLPPWLRRRFPPSME